MIKIECNVEDVVAFLANKASDAEAVLRAEANVRVAWDAVDVVQAQLTAVREELGVAKRTLTMNGINQPVGNAEHVRDLLTAFNDGAKIQAIKMVRTLTGYGLKEAKDLVEDFAPFRPVRDSGLPTIGEVIKEKLSHR